MINRPTGYTLIELVVVVAMLGTLLGFAVPRMADRLFIDDVDATAKWLKIQTTRLRETAQQTQVTHVLRVDLSGRQFFLETENAKTTETEAPQTAALKLADGLHLDQVLLGKAAIPMTTQAQIRFFSDGAADMAILHMTDKANQRFAWIIEPFLTTVTKMEEHGQYADYWQ